MARRTLKKSCRVDGARPALLYTCGTSTATRGGAVVAVAVGGQGLREAGRHAFFRKSQRAAGTQ